MIRVIVHAAKIIITVVTALMMFSCGFEKNFKKVDGTGNVLVKSRVAAEEFTEVSAGGGLEVIVEQGSQRAITVEADQNLHEHIITEIKDGKLTISTDANIRNAKALKVTVQLPVIESLESGSAATLKSKGTLKTEDLELESGSGSTLDVSVDAKEIHCESGSGSHMSIKGIAEKLKSDASSGSQIDAKNLMVKKAVAEASSGGTTYLDATEDLSAQASSGGHIFYKSTPNSMDKKTSSGGEVSQE